MEMMTDMVIFWLVVMVALIVIELATLGLTTIWFACGALVAVVADTDVRGGILCSASGSQADRSEIF